MIQDKYLYFIMFLGFALIFIPDGVVLGIVSGIGATIFAAHCLQ